MAEKVSSTRKQRKQFRQLGINRRSCLKAYLELKADGMDMEDKEAVAIEMETMFSVAALDNTKIDWENIDWAAVLAFIMKLIELIMKFL